MNIRERMQVFWSGEQPDEIPYTIYQNEWRHTAGDPAWQPMYENGLGVTWHLPTVELQRKEVEFVEQTTMDNRHTILRRTIRTPVGEVFETYVDGWHNKYYLETVEDYEVMAFVAKHTEVVPAYDSYHEMDEKIGPYGIPIVALGRTPLQIIQVDYAGLEHFAYHLFDFEEEMLALYELMLANLRRAVEFVANGPGQFVSVLENFTAESLGPKRFEQFLLPVYEELFPELQRVGKIVGTHFDGQLASCSKLIAGAPIDLIESLTPPPEGDLTLAEARQVWPDKLFWSNINVASYYLPERELQELVLQRVAEGAVDGRLLAFEVSEQYPDNWRESIPVVQAALRETRR